MVHRKKSQIKFLEVKVIVTEIKNTLVGINRWLDIVEGKIGELEDVVVENIQNEIHREKNL